MKELSISVTSLEDGWLQVKVPLPFSLKWVNSYLLADEHGWTLIDPGLRTDETIAFWMETLTANKIEWGQIKSIVLTHHHPDHYGLAGWFQQRTGAPVYLSQVALDCAVRLWAERETFSQELTEAFLQHGMVPELLGDMSEHMQGFRTKVSPQPQAMNILHAGQVFRMGGLPWEIIGGEGHAPGHLSFYNRDSGKLICGDQVLPDISPNIGWMPEGDPDPLGSYLYSLRGMLPLEVTMAYPGHRNPFQQFTQRIEELLEHHERRLLKMLELFGDHDISAFEVCELLFSTRLRSNAHQLRFALAETIAHIIQLENRGIVVRSDTGFAMEGLGGRFLIRYRRK
ncbi:MBL fold metallo-hydrolase [Cohnella sp.]|uniref:MBL fold metallo-hydrolase n=1 Tax=Cohnella sp. TaxID=1883426 RepID=UPI0035667F77